MAIKVDKIIKSLVIQNISLGKEEIFTEEMTRTERKKSNPLKGNNHLY